MLINTRYTNQHREVVFAGTETVIAPGENLSLPRRAVPEVSMRRSDRFKPFLKAARDLPPRLTAIVHPCNEEAIQATLEARDEDLIAPVLIGPEQRIREAAEKAGHSIAGCGWNRRNIATPPPPAPSSSPPQARSRR